MVATSEGLVNMRVNSDHSDIFDTFVNYFLVKFTTSLNWRYKSYNTNISDIFSISDEDICILILENNAQDFLAILSTGSTLSRKESRTKYTKSKGVTQAKFKDWNSCGIKRYNFLVRNVKNNRATVRSKELEERLKDKYKAIFKQNNKGETIINDGEDEDNSSDEDEDEDEDAYDGFKGDYPVSESIDKTISRESSNVTGVQ